MKVLILTNHYMDDNNGGANHSKATIRALAEIYSECTLMYPRRRKDKAECFVPPGINAVPVYDGRSKFEKGLDVYRGRLTRLPRVVKVHLQEHSYDVIVIDRSLVAGGIMEFLKRTTSKIVTIHHNDETQYMRDNKPSWPIRLPQMYFARMAENDCLTNSYVNITLTEYDADNFRRRLSSPNNHVYNMGTFQYEDLDRTVETKNIQRGTTFAITGSLYFKQSSVPVVDFIKRYYPLLKQIVPEAKLIVAGRNPSKDVEEICAADLSIELIPNPENMQDVIARADYYICPVNAGSGVKLRAMDGLRLGLPVLAHEISCHGYESIVQDGFMFGYHDEDTFKQALTSMMAIDYNPQNVYNSFYSYFSFESGKKRLKDILAKVKLT